MKTVKFTDHPELQKFASGYVLMTGPCMRYQIGDERIDLCSKTQRLCYSRPYEEGPLLNDEQATFRVHDMILELELTHLYALIEHVVGEKWDSETKTWIGPLTYRYMLRGTRFIFGLCQNTDRFFCNPFPQPPIPQSHE